MRSYYIRAASCANPYFPDGSEANVKAPSAEKALDYFVANYDHPRGLCEARVYASRFRYYQSAQDYIIEWVSPEAAKQKESA
jgi:hypothetical protein